MAITGLHADLTKAQWEEIRFLVAQGEQSNRSIAKQYGISEMSVRRRFPSKETKVREAGQLLARAATPKQYEKAVISLRNLDKRSRTVAVEIMQDLQEISMNLASGAKVGSETFKRMSELAHGHTEMIDMSNDPSENAAAAKNVMMYTQIANEAAKTGVQLIAANKSLVDGALKDVEPSDFVPVDAVEASRAYQKLINGT